MNPAVYVTNQRGFTHLTDHDSRQSGVTLCGRRLSWDDDYGDETVAGLRSDCQPCKSDLKARNR